MATINHTQFAQALADDLESAGVTLDKSSFVSAFVADLGNWVGAYTSNPVLAQRLVEVLARIEGILLSNGVPDEETGEVGAFAFDVVGKAFYGPKAEAGWGAAQAVVQGPPGDDGEEVSLQVTATHIQWRLGTGAWQNLVALSAITGPAGADAEEISVQASATHIQWRRGEGAWVNIVALADLAGADAEEISLQVTATHIQWRLGAGAWQNLIALSALKGDQGDPGNSIELQTTATHIQWREVGAAEWTDLVALSLLEGPTGEEVSLQVTATHIQWRIGAGAWQNLVALADLKGEKGDPFDWDASGAYAGRSAFDGEAEDFAYLALDGAAGGGGPAVLYIKNSGTSGDWSDAVPFQGPAGVDAEEISVQASATHIQWRRGEGAWVDIVALADLAGTDGIDGDDGQEVGLQVTATHIQWRLGAGAWQNLVALSDLKGDTGPGLPAGGTAGQIPAKVDGADFNIEWIDPPTGGGMQVAEIQTAAFTPEIGMAYPVSTAGGLVTLSALPAGAEQGDRFELHDSGRSWGATNKVIVPGTPYDTWFTNPGGVVIFEYDGAAWQTYIQSGEDPADYVEPHIARPTITSPANGATEVGETPTITSSAFLTVNGSDSHEGSDWKITSDEAGETVVVQSLDDTTNKTSWTVPAGNFATATTYYPWVRHTGATYGDSEWSPAGSFTTQAEFVDVDAVAYINALASAPSAGLEAALIAVFEALKTEGLWAKLDRMSLMSGVEAQGAALDLKNPAGPGLTFMNSPAYSPLTGLSLNGSSQYIKSGYVPSTDADQAGLDDMLVGELLTPEFADAGANYLFGTNDGSGGFLSFDVSANPSPDSIFYYINGGASSASWSSNAVRTTAGFWALTRPDSANVAIYHDGVLMDTEAVASTALPGAELYFGCRNQNGSPLGYLAGKIRACVIARHLTAAEQLALVGILDDYQTAIAAL